MEKRLLAAIALSLLVLLSWSAFVAKTQPIANKAIIENTPTSSPSASIPSPIKPVELNSNPEKQIKFKSDFFEITFIESSAAIKEITFKHYKDFPFFLKYGFLLNEKDLNFKKESETSESITFVHSDSTKRIFKRFIFHNNSYAIDLEIKIQNISNAPLNLKTPLILGVLDLSAKNIQARYQDISVATQEKTIHLNPQKVKQFSGVKFLSLRDRYFCAIVEPESMGYIGFISKPNVQESEIGLTLQDLTIQPNVQIGQLFHCYIGPQDVQIINSIKSDWTSVIYYGTFDFISQILLQTLEFLYRIFHNWGWAIIALSILIYLCLYPLSIKQMRSMKQMQAIQPKIEELKKKYKDNPQKLNKETMELYREHKVNPFGGCLPLILQMPIFFALYNALMRSIVLRGANFLWIKDLSEPDRLFTLPVTLPVLGNEFNILPIIMAIGMFFQQKISSVSMNSAAAEQQKIMLILMPVMFGLIFYRMPAGLVLYWLVNSILMLVFQLRMNRAK